MRQQADQESPGGESSSDTTGAATDAWVARASSLADATRSRTTQIEESCRRFNCVAPRLDIAGKKLANIVLRLQKTIATQITNHSAFAFGN